MSVYTDYTEVLKATYREKADTLKAHSELYDRLKKSSKGVKGTGEYYVEWAVDTALNTASRLVSHGGYIPGAQSSPMIKAQLSLANVFTPMQVDGITISNGAIIGDGEALTNELDRGWNDIALQMEEVFWLPQDGFLCTASISSTGQSITVNSTRFLHVGMVIDTYTSLSTTPTKVGDSVTISAINRTTKVITVSGSVNVTAGDGIVRDDSYNKYPGGVGAVMNDGTLIGASNYYTWFANRPVTSYAGLLRTSYPTWTGTVLRHGTPGTLRTLTEGLIGEALQVAQAYNKNQGGQVEIWCDGGMAYTIAKLNTDSVIVNQHKEKEVGFLTATYYDYVNGRTVTIVPMKSAFPHTIIIAPVGGTEIRWTHEPAYDESDGRIWTSQTKNNISGTYSGRDIALANINTRVSLIGKNPANWVVLTDISYNADMTNYPL